MIPKRMFRHPGSYSRKAAWLAIYWAEWLEAIEHRKAAFGAAERHLRAYHAGHHRALLQGLKGARMALKTAGRTLP